MDLVLLFAMSMIPAAIAWAVAYLVARQSRIKRIALFLVFYLILGFLLGMSVVIFAPVWLPGTLVTLAVFERALARKTP